MTLLLVTVSTSHGYLCPLFYLDISSYLINSLNLSFVLEILHDIQKRERTKHKWKSRDQQFVLSLIGGPTVKNVARGKNDVVLSMLNRSYQVIMWSHFQKLGKKGTGEETMAKSILVLLKKTLGKKGNFYKKEQRTADLYEVDEDEALASKYREIQYFVMIDL